MWHMTQAMEDGPRPERWQAPEIVPTGNHSFRVIAKLKPELELSDGQVAYGLLAVVIGQTTREVERLMQWQDQKAEDWERMHAEGSLP